MSFDEVSVGAVEKEPAPSVQLRVVSENKKECVFVSVPILVVTEAVRSVVDCRAVSVPL